MAWLWFTLGGAGEVPFGNERSYGVGWCIVLVLTFTTVTIFRVMWAELMQALPILRDALSVSFVWFHFSSSLLRLLGTPPEDSMFDAEKHKLRWKDLLCPGRRARKAQARNNAIAARRRNQAQRRYDETSIGDELEGYMTWVPQQNKGSSRDFDEGKAGRKAKTWWNRLHFKVSRASHTQSKFSA